MTKLSFFLTGLGATSSVALGSAGIYYGLKGSKEVQPKKLPEKERSLFSLDFPERVNFI